MTSVPEFRDAVAKGNLRRVRTPEGARYFGLPIGSIITPKAIRAVLHQDGPDLVQAALEREDLQGRGMEGMIDRANASREEAKRLIRDKERRRLSKEFRHQDLISKHGNKGQPGYRLLHPGLPRGTRNNPSAAKPSGDYEKRMEGYGKAIQRARNDAELQDLLNRAANDSLLSDADLDDVLNNIEAKHRGAPEPKPTRGSRGEKRAKLEAQRDKVSTQAPAAADNAPAGGDQDGEGKRNQAAAKHVRAIGQVQTGDTAAQRRVLQAIGRDKNLKAEDKVALKRALDAKVAGGAPAKKAPAKKTPAKKAPAAKKASTPTPTPRKRAQGGPRAAAQNVRDAIARRRSSGRDVAAQKALRDDYLKALDRAPNRAKVAEVVRHARNNRALGPGMATQIEQAGDARKRHLLSAANRQNAANQAAAARRGSNAHGLVAPPAKKAAPPSRKATPAAGGRGRLSAALRAASARRQRQGGKKQRIEQEIAAAQSDADLRQIVNSINRDNTLNPTDLSDLLDQAVRRHNALKQRPRKQAGRRAAKKAPAPVVRRAPSGRAHGNPVARDDTDAIRQAQEAHFADGKGDIASAPEAGLWNYVRQNPDRFEVKRNGDAGVSDNFWVTDKATGERWMFKESHFDGRKDIDVQDIFNEQIAARLLADAGFDQADTKMASTAAEPTEVSWMAQRDYGQQFGKAGEQLVGGYNHLDVRHRFAGIVRLKAAHQAQLKRKEPEGPARLAIFDYLINNATDRHAKNFMVLEDKDRQGARLAIIDNGLAFEGGHVGKGMGFDVAGDKFLKRYRAFETDKGGFALGEVIMHMGDYNESKVKQHLKKAIAGFDRVDIDKVKADLTRQRRITQRQRAIMEDWLDEFEYRRDWLRDDKNLDRFVKEIVRQGGTP